MGCALFVGPAPVAAQSSAYAAVSGTVRGGVGEPLAQATVTLTPVTGGEGTVTETSGSGVFTFRLVRPGSYELRIEALGYRPLVARTLSLSGGDAGSVDLTLTADPPPVESVDTVAIAGTVSSRWRAGGVRFGDGELGRIPHRSADLASVVALSSAFDESLGAMGLPGDATLVVADGVPFYRAPHPGKRQEQLPAPLFPVASVGSVLARPGPADVDWPGTAGGYVGVATTASTDGVELGGFYSGDPLWSSSELDFERPSLLSYEGTARGTVPFESGGQLVVVGDVLEHQTPMAGRIPEDVATDLAALDADFLGQLTEPGVETYSRYSGMARLDLPGGETSGAFVRGAGSYARRSFKGAGPLDPSGAPGLADESVDLQLAGGYVTQMSSSTVVELRGGFSGSYRDFKDGPLGAPPAFLVGPAATLGNVPFTEGASSRSDLVLTPMIRFHRGGGAWKAGLALRVSDHSMERGSGVLSERLYSDAGALLSGRGFAQRLTVPEASFGTQEYGVFAQYETAFSGGLEVRIGGRLDLERMGIDQPALNQEWLATTGLSNVDYPTSLTQLGVGGSVTWRPSGSDATRVVVTGSLREGDLDARAIAEVVGSGTAATVTDYAGAGLGWLAGSIPSGAEARTTLTLLGPDVRAPRTTTLSVALQQRITPEVTLLVEGASRRTDFLLRRRDLNLPVVPQAVDQDGRPVYGTLQQDGALITATGDDGRRFPDFGAVYALDPDGWSKYRGATLGLEYAGPAVDLFGSYTYSETTDNWVGAAGGVAGAELRPGVPGASEDEPWSDGTSDFDVPHRAAAGVSLRIGGSAEVSGLYRYRSGLPFTPGLRLGVDANGDGSVRNDVAYVPEDGLLLDSDSCLVGQGGAFAVRNSCRGPDMHTVNARLRVRLGALGGRSATLTVDALNLMEYSGGVVDQALLVADPAGTITASTDGSTVTTPLTINDAFHTVRYPISRGRMIRVGVRIGG